MNNKTLASLIIGLCSISIIVGIFNTTISLKGHQHYKGHSSGFKSMFYSGDKIALITLEGPITSEDTSELFSKSNTASSVKKALTRAYEDNKVKGVLLKIDSPGGTVAMSQEINNTILRLRKKKPVVVSMSDLAASGGYYIACAADRIYADPGTLTGSIGVIMSSFNAQELLTQKLGIQSNVIKSGKFKDIGSPYRAMTPDERSLLQNVINSTYEQFISAIVESRVNRKDNYNIEKSNLTTAQLRKYADGRIFTGLMAQKLGFVDQIGGTYEAQKAVNKMVKSRFNLTYNLPLVPYNVSSGFEDILNGVSESIMPYKSLVSTGIPLTAKYPHQPLLLWE